ncbi:MAG: hypothetical protein IT374_26015 [Polyangiaceae bacterium]|nr:hypothetical protein [Polyangiaceae bacterium]
MAICSVRLRERDNGSARRIRSDYRCQVRYGDTDGDFVARVYLVGQDTATSGEDVPVLVAFLDWEAQRDRCRVECHFELREGNTVTGVGTVGLIATRSDSSLPVWGGREM